LGMSLAMFPAWPAAFSYDQRRRRSLTEQPATGA
jgi:hypothetical protein